MKKIFFIAALFLSITAFAQKTVYVFNFSSYSIDIGEFGTKHATNGIPYFKSNHSSLINIPAGDTYILENTNPAYFPLYSPTSTPYIANWRRQGTVSGAWTNLLSTNLNNVNAAPQVYYYTKFQVGPNGTLGGGTMGLSPYPSAVSGTGWVADYTTNADETIIMISDN